MKFSAVLHGADPKAIEDKEIPSSKTLKSNLQFGDPADYANLSETEKKELTEKMKGKFMKWAGVKNG